MIRFQELAKNKDIPEFHTPGRYQEIKSTGNTTKEQSLKFWDNLFDGLAEKERENNIENDPMIAEIFGRYEDEFEIDFIVDDDIKAVLDKFSVEKWESLSEAERKDVVCELASTIGEKLTLEKIPDVRFFDGAENNCGAYNLENNAIEVNRNIFSNPKEVVDTVAHEMRHAYQHQHSQKPESYVDLLYKCNFENYISPIKLPDGKYLFFIDYQDQLVEVEARAFASLFTSKGEL